MTRVQAYLDTTTRALLSDYAQKNDCSLSHAAGNIIAAHLLGEARDVQHRSESKQQFLRLINVLNQVLMCVYDADKVSIDSASAKECLENIKHSVRELVND